MRRDYQRMEKESDGRCEDIVYKYNAANKCAIKDVETAKRKILIKVANQ